MSSQVTEESCALAGVEWAELSSPDVRLLTGETAFWCVLDLQDTYVASLSGELSVFSRTAAVSSASASLGNTLRSAVLYESFGDIGDIRCMSPLSILVGAASPMLSVGTLCRGDVPLCMDPVSVDPNP